jgi:hypothetical protein
MPEKHLHLVLLTKEVITFVRLELLELKPTIPVTPRMMMMIMMMTKTSSISRKSLWKHNGRHWRVTIHPTITMACQRRLKPNIDKIEQIIFVISWLQ